MGVDPMPRKQPASGPPWDKVTTRKSREVRVNAGWFMRPSGATTTDEGGKQLPFRWNTFPLETDLL